MARAVLTNVVVFDQRLFVGDGEVKVWMDRVTNEFERQAFIACPVRSGKLKASIRASTKTVGAHRIDSRIRVGAGHALFVLRGTSSPIMRPRARANPGGAWDSKGRRRKGYFMRLPAWGPYPKKILLQVSGQEANNFLLKAWDVTATRHPAIRGHTPVI